jgi:hypothetical protein
MKRLYTTSEFKRLNTKRSKDAVKKRRKRKNKKGYSGHTTNANQNQGGNFYNRPTYTPPQIVPIKAPDDFSLINNTELTIEYFNNAHNELKKKNRILFDISHIKTLTTDAIAVQIAKIKDSKFHLNNGIIGNEPKDETLKKLFVQSGFYDYVNTRGPKPTNDKKLLIHEITNNRVEPDIAKAACLLGLKHTFQNEEIFEPLYDILIEVMQNTNNHAGETRGVYDGYMFIITPIHLKLVIRSLT